MKSKSKDVSRRVKYVNPSKQELVKILKRKLEKNDRKGFNEISRIYNAQAKKEFKEKAKNELYGKQIRREKLKNKFNKGLKRLEKYGRKKVISRKTLKNERATVVIKQVKPEPYRSAYFKDEYEKEKRSMFLK